ncbi:MAG: hypothetical protein IKU28_05340, partial [Erysipelotrichaceae bacterium]|nr:hypothetical protein [Erysipelotrichaceae bacterium]
YTEYINPEKPETWKIARESTGFHAYPKLNPAYNPEEEYISREHRKEWDAVGLLGKLHANDDGSCVVGSYASVADGGFLTSSTERTNMRVMKRITDNIVLVLLK